MVDPLNSDAAARALTDALAAPGTPEELSRETEYVAMFLAVQGELRHGGGPAVTQLLPRDAPTAVRWSDAPEAPADDLEPSPLAFFEQRAAAQGAPAAAAALGAHEPVAGSPTGPGIARRRHRRRLALIGGLAAVAITGTAAAVSTTLVNQSPERPPTSTGPLPGTSGASSRTPQGTPGETLTGGATGTGGPGGTTPTGAPGPAVGPGAGTAPGGGPTTVPPAGRGTGPTTGQVGTTTTPAPTPSTTTSAPSPTTSSPSPSDTGKIPHGQLVSACKQFEKGKLDPTSPKYQLLLGLAGSADKILAYCKDVVGK